MSEKHYIALRVSRTDEVGLIRCDAHVVGIICTYVMKCLKPDCFYCCTTIDLHESRGIIGLQSGLNAGISN